MADDERDVVGACDVCAQVDLTTAEISHESVMLTAKIRCCFLNAAVGIICQRRLTILPILLFAKSTQVGIVYITPIRGAKNQTVLTSCVPDVFVYN